MDPIEQFNPHAKTFSPYRLRMSPDEIDAALKRFTQTGEIYDNVGGTTPRRKAPQREFPPAVRSRFETTGDIYDNIGDGR